MRQPVALEAGPLTSATPSSIRRRARVAASTDAGEALVRIDDTGPGLFDKELA